jgi:putative membrane protein
MMGYSQGYGHGYGYNGMMGGGFGGLLVFLFGLLLIAGIVLLVMWAVRVSNGHGHGTQGIATQPPMTVDYGDAMAIARRRLASGEINKEQYEEIMRLLAG